MIVLVDYQAGNIRSVAKALEAVGATLRVTSDWRDVRAANKIVLPGVGAFGGAIQILQERDLFDPLLEHLASGKPFLGICLGAQLLFERSAESPGVEGFALFPGECLRFPTGQKVPHLGWNRVFQRTESPLWEGVPEGAWFYFAHAYYVHSKEDGLVIGETEYGIRYASAIQHGGVLFGVQFHPEKSQRWGLKVLENFVRL